jgi:uncharacterized delta-60 repeat protein
MSVKGVVIGGMLLGTVLAGVMIWHWNRAPIRLAVPKVGSFAPPTASVSRLSSGILAIGFGSPTARAVGLALQADGTIVTLASTVLGGSERNFIVRVTGSGQLAAPHVAALAGATSFGRGLSIARDGRIAVAGSGPRFLVELFLPTGTPDRTFGQEGMTLTNVQWRWWGSSDGAWAVAVQDDGKIIATGSSDFPSGFLDHRADCATVRYNRDGSFDRTFGDAGRVLTHVEGTESCGATAVLIARDGKILVAGTIGFGNGQHASAVLRYLSDGTVDRQFGQDGVAEALGGTAWSAALDSQDKVVLAGGNWLSPTRSQFWLARFDTNGELDPSFGEGGIVAFHESGGSQILSGVTVQHDGKVVAAGRDLPELCQSCAAVANADERIAAVRLNANGSRDESFADHGVLFTSSPRYQWEVNGMAIQPDNRLLIVGDRFERGTGTLRASSLIILMRLNEDGTPDASFGAGRSTSR